MDYNTKYNHYYTYFENALKNNFALLDKDAPEIIREAMTYAVMNGGKRIRPILCLATTEVLGGEISSAVNFALSIEFIHSYSLVHDDLPSMDNDDYRRGKLSTHKKFGEAYGILAGDALLNYAFETCLSGISSEKEVKAARVIARCAGYSGMIAGQALDIACEKNLKADVDVLRKIYVNKTSMLLTAPLLVASELCDGKFYDELKKFGTNLGILFQITDDFMDADGDFATIGKTPKKDEKENKLTSIKVLGRSGAEKLMKTCYEECSKILETIPNAEVLSAFLNEIYKRKS